MTVHRSAATLLLGLLLASCSASSQPEGDGGATGTATPPPSGVAMSPSTPSSGQPSAGRPSSDRPSSGAGQTTGEVTMTGRVELLEIEGGCLVLRVGTQGYQLLGVDRQSARPGTTVTVRGRIRTDVMTTCQVGPVLEVAEIRPA